MTVDQEIDVADIIAGNLKFVPLPGQTGTGYDSFEFRVHDGTDYLNFSSLKTVLAQTQKSNFQFMPALGSPS